MNDIDEMYSQLVHVPMFSLNFDMQSMLSELSVAVYDNLLEQEYGVPTGDILLGSNKQEFEQLKVEIAQLRESTIENLKNHNEEYGKSIRTPTEAYIYNGNLILNLELQEGNISNTSSYFHDYTDFDNDTFKSYIYWRTHIRKNELIETPRTFIFAYICELANLIEKDTPQETWNRFLELRTLFEDNMMIDNITESNARLRYINDSMISFAILYGDYIINSNEFLQRELEIKFYEEHIKFQILNENYTSAYDYILKHSEYKIAKSKFYFGENIETIKKCIPYVIQYANRYFLDNGVKLLYFWLGDNSETRFNIDPSIKIRVNKFISDKVINIYDTFHIWVKGNDITCDRFHSYKEDTGCLLFGRQYTISYIIWYMEKILRQFFNFKPTIRPSLKSLENMNTRAKVNGHIGLQKVIELYSADEFEIVITKAIKKALGK